MYVTELNIKEFRGIKECRETLKFTKFNILLGRNNSGKSAILHALSLLPHSHLNLPISLNFGGQYKIDLITYLLGGRSS